MPMLYQCLANVCPGAVPPAMLTELEEHFVHNARRTFAFSGELLKCLNLLGAHGIPAVPFKGPVLAATAYGDYAMRQFDYLDVLVHEKHVLRARDLLVSQGYRPEFELTAAQQRAYLGAQSEFKVLRDEGEVIVELHWRITERYFAFPLDPQQLWERLVPVSLAGQEVWTCAAEDQLLILCVHGTKHLWTRLAWIVDVAKLVSAHAAMDWRAVMEQARRLGSSRMLLLGLSLVRDLLGVPLPPAVLGAVNAEVAVASLANQAYQWLFRDERPGDVETSLFHLKARERMQDRVCYCFRLAVTTTPGDWALVRLPAPLFPLYYFLRPIRLVAAYGPALLRRLL